MARKARETPMKGSLKINFNETGEVRSFEIKGRAADIFFKGLVDKYNAKQVDVKKSDPQAQARCTACNKIWWVKAGEVKKGDMPQCPECGSVGVATGKSRA